MLRTAIKWTVLPILAIALSTGLDSQTAEAGGFSLSVGGGRGLNIYSGGHPAYRGYRSGFRGGYYPPRGLHHGYRSFYGPTYRGYSSGYRGGYGGYRHGGYRGHFYGAPVRRDFYRGGFYGH